jgi:3-phosphoshikimate 1-carboxyvinyltransferase
MSAALTELPERLPIEPLTRPPRAVVRVPGSKSITNRALVLAVLGRAGAEVALHGALRSEDTEVMIGALRALGVEVQTDWPQSMIRVRRPEGTGPIPASSADLFVANSGTTMRFLTALVSLGPGRYRLDGIERMRERPIEDLLAALHQLGVRADSEAGNGCPPVVVEGRGLAGGMVRIRGDVSSQFLSGLLMAAAAAAGDLAIHLDGPLVSVPYVAMTVAMMRQWGLRVDAGEDRFLVPGNQHTILSYYSIEPDASAASYFWAAAAVAGGEVAVPGLSTASLQGDVRFLDLLEQMGCRVARTEAGTTVQGGRLTGIDVDMNDISDTVMTLGVVACFADAPTTIRNVGHVRHKETDRLAALATELRRLGAAVEERRDGLTITPRPLQGTVVETYNDHRMAMSLALVGLRVPGMVLSGPACVAKTYPGYFDDLERLRC